MFDGLTGGIVIGAVVAVLIVLLAQLRPPPPMTKPWRGRKSTFVTTVPYADAFRAIASPPAEEKLKVQQFDAQARRVLLSDGMGWTSWGFWYPVDFVERDDGTTEVSVGIWSKAFQWGPFVGRAQDRMTATVRRLVEYARRD